MYKGVKPIDQEGYWSETETPELRISWREVLGDKRQQTLIVGDDK